MSLYISKTDYLEYTYCRKNLWLKKHKPELFDGVELSEFEKKIIEEGNAADADARNLFSDGTLIDIVGRNAVPATQTILTTRPRTLFQGAFMLDEFFVQADILHWNDVLDGWELYEVKATNDVSRTIPHHHVNDLAFQKTVIEGSLLTRDSELDHGLRQAQAIMGEGQEKIKIVKAGVIHLNGTYKKHGAINYKELFVIADVTDEVIAAQDLVREQMSDLKSYLHDKEEKGCECLYRGRNNQCTTFAYSNPDVPEYSVHDIARIGGSKKLLNDWIDRGIYAIEDIDRPEVLEGAKKAQYDAYMLGKPLIDNVAIKELLDTLVFPLQFFDYEGYSSAIPKFDGFAAYEQVPFQYSLHIMQKNGELEHREFLITEPVGDLTLPLIERMKLDIDPNGTVIAWYKSYESQRNNKLAELHPEHAAFLEQINDQMFDLMSIFSKNYYVDAAFKGSSSIKKVLPVIVPSLSYKKLKVQKGDQAIERWEKMIAIETSQEEKDQIAKDLLEYCKLDTFAMVEIYRFLRKLV